MALRATPCAQTAVLLKEPTPADWRSSSWWGEGHTETADSSQRSSSAETAKGRRGKEHCSTRPLACF
eukprot:7072792-Alexandrium_andersonii.AAC.1